MSNVKKSSLKAKSCDYTVKKSKQKGIRMRVTAKGELVIHANPFCTSEEIHSYVLKHLNDISYQPSVRLFGRSFKVRKVKTKTNHVSYSENELLIQFKDAAQIESMYKLFLKQISSEVFEDIVDMMYLRFKEYNIVRPNIIIRNMKSSWGVCHPEKNSITLNSELVHYPVDFIEYVICHEMIHLIEANHSQSFYSILSELMPDYKRRLDLIETSNEKQYLM